MATIRHVTTTSLDAPALRAVMAGFDRALRSHREALNALNVYPVPDGDTGTNMMMTVDSVVAELDELDADADLTAVTVLPGYIDTHVHIGNHFDDDGKVHKIVEKPANPETNKAVIGIYMYDAEVFDTVRTLKPSGRGELEITDVNNAYIERGTMTLKDVVGCISEGQEELAVDGDDGPEVGRPGFVSGL